MKTQTSFYGWKLVAVMWFILFANMGFPMVSGSVANAYMASDLHLSRTTVGLAFSVFTAITGLLAPLVAVVINKKGVRFTLLLGGLLLVAGCVFMALFVHTGAQLIGVFGVLIGLGGITGGLLPALAGISRWFLKRRARAISLITTGYAVGAMVAPPVLIYLIQSSHGNWRIAWWLSAALSAAATLLTVLFVKESPADLGQLPDGNAGAADVAAAAARGNRLTVFRTSEDWTVAAALRTPALWWIIVSGLGFGAGFTLFGAHGVLNLRDVGLLPEQVASSLSLVALLTLCGTLLVGAIGDHIEPRLILAVSLLTEGIGLLMALKAGSTANLYLFPVFLGLGLGAGSPSSAALFANWFGNKAYASLISFISAAGFMVGAIASYGAGYAYDHFRSYALAFYACFLLCFLGFVILLFVRPPARRAPKPLAVVAAAG
jgi:OFA family oxalate/formate antiporter-like MFS transporter